jgi:hypothetical protein
VVSERLVVSIAGALIGQHCSLRSESGSSLSDSPGSSEGTGAHLENAAGTDHINEALLVDFDLAEIREGLLWMSTRGLLSAHGWGHVVMAYQLTAKGVAVATDRRLSSDDQLRIRQPAVSLEPEIYGVRVNLKEIWWRIRKFLRGGRGA